ncbi:MAG: BglII/BstYI family type II restriction endonuclease, partial [Candidatus Helarchaeota archaeon]
WNINPRIKVNTYIPETKESHSGFREMDAIKNKLGVEVQFGKYAFMVYNVAAKMTIFSKQNLIDSGIEIVPMLSFARDMSTGVSYFEQMKTDLEMRGVSNIDIPVLIIGIAQKKLVKNQLKLI